MKQTQYGKYTYNSPSVIRRITHKLRLKRSIEHIGINQNDKVLDYGAGDGYLVTLLYKLNNKNITCFEPMSEQFNQLIYLLSDYEDVQKVNNILEISNQTYNKIFCLEVLEHLPYKQLTNVLQEIYQLLDDNGKALLTVPCESGINGFIKNCIKKFVDKNRSYTYKDLWKIAHNTKKIERIVEHTDTNPYIYEHFGFNNIELEQYIKMSKLKVEKKVFFPIKYFNLFSSQIFYVVSK